MQGELIWYARSKCCGCRSEHCRDKVFKIRSVEFEFKGADIGATFDVIGFAGDDLGVFGPADAITVGAGGGHWVVGFHNHAQAGLEPGADDVGFCYFPNVGQQLHDGGEPSRTSYLFWFSSGTVPDDLLDTVGVKQRNIDPRGLTLAQFVGVGAADVDADWVAVGVQLYAAIQVVSIGAIIGIADPVGMDAAPGGGISGLGAIFHHADLEGLAIDGESKDQ